MSTKKYNFIYKTTCTLTNKFYVGMHSTDDLEDGYVGSGKYLWRSIRKYGIETHQTEILEFLLSRTELEAREACIVNEEFLNDPLCMNLKPGGVGGGKFKDEDHQFKCSSAGGKVGGKTSGKLNGANNFKKAHSEGKIRYDTFTGKSHTVETKARMSRTKKESGFQVGESNSQFGTCWIYSLEEMKSIKIPKDQLEQYLELGWKKGRKIAEKHFANFCVRT